MSTSSEPVVSKLNDLIELDYDAIEAYQAAIERLENASFRKKLGEFCKDHEHHTKNLATLVKKHGGTSAEGPDLKRILTKGKVVIGGLVGDHAILLAMRANEEVTNKRYEMALAADQMDAETRKTVEGNLADERRHREWIVEQLNTEHATTSSSA
jgi:uncharacterized protein (TIGR02284 family)